MAFVKVKPKLTARGSGTSSITMGAYLSEGISKPRQITIRIPKAVMDSTGFPVKDRHISVDIHEGVGDDIGFIMIYHSEEHGATWATQGQHQSVNGAENLHGFSVSFRAERFQYYTPNEWPQAATPVTHVMDDGNILLEVPEWFKPNINKMIEDGHMKAKEPEPAPLPAPEPGKKSAKSDRDTKQLNRQARRAIGSHVARVLK